MNEKPFTSLETIVSLAKRRGFVFPSSEIYGGFSGFFDYGPLGVALKENLKILWRRIFVEGREDVFFLDTAILTKRKVLEVSGHTAGFNDPLVECKDCRARFRQDELDSAASCPSCGGKNFSPPRQFNMMFQTKVGAADDSAAAAYLRPETAQGIFVNFKNIVDSFRPKLPFGIAQIGKAFRNEITPRDFLFRLREFEQMEVEYFVGSQEWEKYFEEWHNVIRRWFTALGLPEERIFEREVPEGERAHYSRRTIDFEFAFPFGRMELCGLAYRGDYDLRRHQEISGADLTYFSAEGAAPDGGRESAPGGDEQFLPQVIEPSLGLDRTVLALLCSAYVEDEMDGEKRVVLKFKPELAPVKFAVFPLLKNKPQLVERAQAIYRGLKKQIPQIVFDDNGNIGKRYRRQDEIGTPWCLTIDFQTLDDGTVTIRDRDTGKQERIKPEEAPARRPLGY